MMNRCFLVLVVGDNNNDSDGFGKKIMIMTVWRWQYSGNIIVTELHLH